jgi:hypothetical protein
MEKGYNGWKNRQTWNVSLWINNDEPLYRCACDYVKRRKQAGKKPTYSGFVRSEGLANMRTPDNISFSGTRLDCKALDEMMEELID